jgi:hypothetical protein
VHKKKRASFIFLIIRLQKTLPHPCSGSSRLLLSSVTAQKQGAEDHSKLHEIGHGVRVMFANFGTAVDTGE